jgi:hypothetical protein
MQEQQALRAPTTGGAERGRGRPVWVDPRAGGSGSICCWRPRCQLMTGSPSPKGRNSVIEESFGADHLQGTNIRH